MFDFLKSNKHKSDTAATMKDAAVKYFETSVRECDKQFSAIWKFDPDWVVLLSVAADLDKKNGNEEKMQKIRDTVMNCFMESKTVKFCTALLLIQHLSNQGELESIMRDQGGGGGMWLPK